MLGAIRRVISGEDIEAAQQQDPSPVFIDAKAVSGSPPKTFVFDATPLPKMQSTPPLAALIETDDGNGDHHSCKEGDNNNGSAMDVDVHHRDGDNSTAGSSLSDVSAAKEHHHHYPHHHHHHSSTTGTGPPPMMMVAEEGHRPPIPPPTTAGAPSIPPPSPRLPRNDSRNSNDSYSSYGRQSSQNSSRDWGWFDDVHSNNLDHPANSGVGGGVGVGGASPSASGNLKRAKDHSNSGSAKEEHNKKKGKRGGGPHNSDDGYQYSYRPGSDRGSPLLPNLGLLSGGGVFGGGDGDGAFMTFQPLAPLNRFHHPVTAMDMESGKSSRPTSRISV
jgi:hypothetical protein